MEDFFDRLSKVTGITKYSGAEVITPKEIVSDMVDLLPPEIFNTDSRFLDPAVKSGRFLAELYRRLMDSPLMVKAFPDEKDRHEHIIHNQLYGFATSAIAATIVRKQLYNDPTIAGNIHYTTAKDVVKEIRGAFENMKFDVVIGNPPYNRGMDLDFVKLGYDLSTKYTVMITPAKWQMGSTDSSLDSKLINYEQFRVQIVPHMKNVCFYPNAADVFDIRGNTGITYFLIDKDIHNECSVENRFSSFPEHYNSTESRDIQNGRTLCNVGNKIIEYMPKTKFSYIRKKFSDKEWVVWGTSAMPMFLDFKPNKSDSHYMTSDLKLTQSKGLNLSNDSFIFFESDSKNECESFISYMYTKLVRFLISCAIGSYKAWNKSETFRFVPAPPAGKFDHIYTDDELCKAFNLPQKYIDVIDAIVKERK